MTTRRQFFGLMAAAPVAAPAIAKELSSPTISRRSYNVYDLQGFSVAPGETIQVARPSRDRTRMRFSNQTNYRGSPTDPILTPIPNRLYGAQVTASGDVV